MQYHRIAGIQMQQLMFRSLAWLFTHPDGRTNLEAVISHHIIPSISIMRLRILEPDPHGVYHTDSLGLGN
jgi:hypothetical protein